MTLALLIVGIFAVLAGLLAILFGYSVREFSVGSTLIISGTVGVCTGLLLVGLYALLLELRGKLADVAAPTQERPSDVVNALLALGYSDKEAQAAIRGIAPGTPVAEGIRTAHKALAK